MRVLVVGGTRFIGPHVVTRLAQNGHEVTVLHRGEHEVELPSSVRHLHATSAGIPLVHYPEAALQARPEIVLHMNVMGEPDARALVSAFHGVARRLVVPSSADVYRAFGVLIGRDEGPPEPMPLDETAALRRSRYPHRDRATGLQEDWTHTYEKLHVERIVQEDPELPATILRLPAVYGPRDPRERIWPYLKRMDDGRPVILLGDQQAGWRWTHGYVEEIAAWIACCVEDERASGRVFNLGPERTATWAEWVRDIGRAAGWRGRIVVLPQLALPAHLQFPGNLAQDLVVDSTRVRRELGCIEPIELYEGLKRTVDWTRGHPPESFDPAAFDYAAEDAALAAGA